MADLPPSPSLPDSNGNTDMGPGRELTPGIPRWVKVFGIVALVLVLLVIIMMFVSGGSHGPGRHIPSSGAGGHMPPIAHGVQQP
jgi:hypothetical protein